MEYLLVIFIILEFNTPYLVFPVLQRTIQIMPLLILLMLLLISGKNMFRKPNPVLFLYFGGSVFPLLVLWEHNYPSYIMRYVLLIPMLWMYLNQRKKFGTLSYCSLFLKFSNVVTVLAVVSVVIWLLGSIAQVFPPTLYFPYEWAPGVYNISSYWGIHFETQTIVQFGERIWRNSGIFNEGPMYNLILCSAFLIEYFIRPERSKTRMWILAITILTTLTTTGQFFLIGMTLWHILMKVGNKYRLLILFMAPILMYCGYVASTKIMENKIETSGGGSVEARSSDISRCIQAGMEHPFLGIGLIMRDGDPSEYGVLVGSSNSLFAVFARGGLHALVLYIGTLLIIPILYYKRNKDSKWSLTMLFFFLLFALTNIFLKYLTFLFIAWGLSNIDLKRWSTGIKSMKTLKTK